jgi:hypothetical protein
MVVGADVIVEDEFEDENQEGSSSSLESKKSEQKTSSGQLNFHAAETTSQQYQELGRDSDIMGSLNNTLSAMKNSYNDSSLISRPESVGTDSQK